MKQLIYAERGPESKEAHQHVSMINLGVYYIYAYLRLRPLEPRKENMSLVQRKLLSGCGGRLTILAMILESRTILIVAIPARVFNFANCDLSFGTFPQHEWSKT